MRQHNAVRVGIENVDDGIGLDEAFDLAEDERPLELIVRLVRRRVLVDVLGQLPHQVPDQLHLLEQEADHDEACVVPEFLHHQVGSEMTETGF